jgi:hypothetical protein
MTGGGEALASAPSPRSSHKDTNMQVEKPDCFVAALLAMTSGGEVLRCTGPCDGKKLKTTAHRSRSEKNGRIKIFGLCSVRKNRTYKITKERGSRMVQAQKNEYGNLMIMLEQKINHTDEKQNNEADGWVSLGKRKSMAVKI